VTHDGSLVSVRDASFVYPGARAAAVDGVSVEIGAGEVVGVMGQNGSGKSTCFNVISGMVPADAGRIALDGKAIESLAPERRQHLGLARTFQEIQLFYDMTVLENVMVGAHRIGRADALAALLRPRWQREEERRLREIARECLGFMGLEALAGERARNIPYGHQRLLEIARALASDPRLLLLDEPAAGMNAGETRALIAQVERIVARGVTVFLVEHNMKLVMGVSDHVIVLDRGRKLAEGRPDEIAGDPRVIEAYLGAEAAHA